MRAARQYLARAIRQRQFAARADRDAYRHGEGVFRRFPLHTRVAVRGAYLRGGARQPAAAKPKDTHVRVQTQLKFSYKEQRDFDTIENRVAELEEKLVQLEKEIAANASDYTKVTELMDTQAKTQQELDEATERWLFLQEKWEQIQAQKG